MLISPHFLLKYLPIPTLTPTQDSGVLSTVLRMHGNKNKY